MSVKLEFSWDASKRRVSTSAPARPRKTPAELRQMSHLDRLFYHLHGPRPTEFERQRELEDEDAIARYGEGEDVLPGSRLWDEGPPDPDDIEWR